jgi:hypothetical protein
VTTAGAGRRIRFSPLVSGCVSRRAGYHSTNHSRMRASKKVADHSLSHAACKWKMWGYARMYLCTCVRINRQHSPTVQRSGRWEPFSSLRGGTQKDDHHSVNMKRE